MKGNLNLGVGGGGGRWLSGRIDSGSESEFGDAEGEAVDLQGGWRCGDDEVGVEPGEVCQHHFSLLSFFSVSVFFFFFFSGSTPPFRLILFFFLPCFKHLVLMLKTWKHLWVCGDTMSPTILFFYFIYLSLLFYFLIFFLFFLFFIRFLLTFFFSFFFIYFFNSTLN